MRTIEQISTKMSETIAKLHNHPEMYIDSISGPNAGEMFDGMMWIAHRFWAIVESREREFAKAFSDVRESHECSSLGFPDAYRLHNPDADEESVFQHVRTCWAEVHTKLGVDLSKQSSET